LIVTLTCSMSLKSCKNVHLNSVYSTYAEERLFADIAHSLDIHSKHHSIVYENSFIFVIYTYYSIFEITVILIVSPVLKHQFQPLGSVALCFYADILIHPCSVSSPSPVASLDHFGKSVSIKIRVPFNGANF